MSTAFYSVLHFLVDFCCAHAMYRAFALGADGYMNILIYNFCAFALQMPLGVILDSRSKTHPTLPRRFAVIGTLLTLLGCVTHPAILGLGNAAFHVGGGVETIREDRVRHWNGRGLGVFVSPGALGLFLGAQVSSSVYIIYLAAVLMLLLLLPLFRLSSASEAESPSSEKSLLLPLLCCFAVVILRSYVGMAVTFSWKQGFALGLAAVLAVVFGKTAGGFAAARYGTRFTVIGSLLLAALCYLWGAHPLFGILALFFFNMTMPITLHQLAIRFPALPGFSFGLLTFGLFLGFLPVYFGMDLPLSGSILGAAGSLISLLLLIPVSWRNEP